MSHPETYLFCCSLEYCWALNLFIHNFFYQPFFTYILKYHYFLWSVWLENAAGYTVKVLDFSLNITNDRVWGTLPNNSFFIVFCRNAILPHSVFQNSLLAQLEKSWILVGIYITTSLNDCVILPSFLTYGCY